MTNAEICALYDDEYARSYTATYLLAERFIECTRYEESLLANLLGVNNSWLDIACGTGYFLSQFPRVRRAGVDLSPSMLKQARLLNPQIPLRCADFRDPFVDWDGQWGFVSCTWYAYCYAGSVEGVTRVIRNMINWTMPRGTCFLPVCDPSVLCKVPISHRPPADSDDGVIRVTGVAWEWIDQPSGRQHRDMFAPPVDFIVDLFASQFEKVEVIAYPAFERDCMQSRKAVVAYQKIDRSCDP
jgi:SAM-dependent methyltransferase